MANRYTLEDIKSGIERYLGKAIIVKANKGRKKIVTRKGVLENTYPDVFVVKVEGNNNTVTRVSYSYADVLTSTVQLKLARPKTSLAN